MLHNAVFAAVHSRGHKVDGQNYGPKTNKLTKQRSDMGDLFLGQGNAWTKGGKTRRLVQTAPLPAAARSTKNFPPLLLRAKGSWQRASGILGCDAGVAVRLGECGRWVVLKHLRNIKQKATVQMVRTCLCVSRHHELFTWPQKRGWEVLL